MDPTTFMAFAGPLMKGMGGGGGSTKLSQSLSNNASFNISSIIQNGAGSPGTGAVSTPQTSSAPSSASGSDSLPMLGGLGSTEVAPSTGAPMGLPSATTGSTSQSTMYYALAGVLGLGAVAYFFFNKKR